MIARVTGVRIGMGYRMMKSRDALIRAGSFDLAEKRRKLSDIEAMIAEFQRMAGDLEQQIEAEQLRTGVREPTHFAYSSFAKAARKRCDNLLVSVTDLDVKRAAAVAEVAVAEEELKRLQMAGERAAEDRPAGRRRPGRNRPVTLGSTTRSP
jgi:flagellar FliJ protein